MSDEYRPREHDHLVEPVFGGLGARAPRRGLLAALGRWLRALFALARSSR
jgi:hypothetical protein